VLIFPSQEVIGVAINYPNLFRGQEDQSQRGGDATIQEEEPHVDIVDEILIGLKSEKLSI